LEPLEKYRIIILINEEYKMNDCELPTDRLWSPNIQGFFNSKMTNLLVIKDPKSDCSIVKSSDDKFYSRFIAKYCSILVLLHG
jgi:hypothetical protein